METWLTGSHTKENSTAPPNQPTVKTKAGARAHEFALLSNQPFFCFCFFQLSTGGRTSAHSAGPINGTENKATFASSGSTPLRRMSSRIGSMMAALRTKKSSVVTCAALELQNSSGKDATASGSE